MKKFLLVFLLMSNILFANVMGSLDNYGGQDYFNNLTPTTGRVALEDGNWLNQYNLLGFPIEFMISAGIKEDWIVIDKFGFNSEITTTSDPETVWSYGGRYNYTTNAGATYYVSSSDNSDTQTVNFQVLTVDSNDNWNLEVFDQDLVGQTKTALTPPSGNPCVRIFRMYNNDNTSFAGNIYVYEDDTTTTPGVPDTASKVRAYVEDGDNQTLMGVFTVATGYVGFLFRGEVGIEYSGLPSSGTDFLNCNYKSRRYGKVFRIKKKLTCLTTGSSNYMDKRSFPDVIPAKTDVELEAYQVSDTMGAFATFDILLIPETDPIFSDEYLTSIGQIKRVE